MTDNGAFTRYHTISGHFSKSPITSLSCSTVHQMNSRIGSERGRHPNLSEEPGLIITRQTARGGTNEIPLTIKMTSGENKGEWSVHGDKRLRSSTENPILCIFAHMY